MTHNMAAPVWMEWEYQPFFVLALLCVEILALAHERELEVEEDILEPYKHYHGPRHPYRVVRSLHPDIIYKLTHEDYPTPSSHLAPPLLHTYPFVRSIGTYWNQRFVTGHYFVVTHPLEMLSVLEPDQPGGCAKRKRATVGKSIQQRKCILATNAGFFNTTTDACIGNVVSDGRVAHKSEGGVNVNFGIRTNGNFFYGYLPEDIDLEAEFSQLLSGVIWLIRDGEIFIDVSQVLESGDAQETGTLDYFVNVRSARLAVGNDRQGRMVIVHVDGQTGVRGVDLHEFADLLISSDVVNAINLDGGGSVSVFLNGTPINYPGDEVKQNGTAPYRYRRQRDVSTLLCVHEPACDSPDCNNHGDCVLGKCHCHGNWAGERCDSLECGLLNCSSHGLCTELGCLCRHGWHGISCDVRCPPGTFGLNCSATCRCRNRAICDPRDGVCHCQPGFTGVACDHECAPGTFGRGCRQLCFCKHTCSCHHVTGSCNITLENGTHLSVGYCMVDKMIRDRHLVVDQPDQYRLWLMTIITLSLVAAISLIMNISLLCLGYFHNCTSSSQQNYKRVRRTYGQPSFPEVSSSDENGVEWSDEKEVIALQNLSPPSEKFSLNPFRESSGNQRDSDHSADP